MAAVLNQARSGRPHERASGERAARLLARLYRCGPLPQRELLLRTLMRPLGVLGLGAVASGVFLDHVIESGTHGLRIVADLAQRHTPDQVYELARFADQVDPAVWQPLLAQLVDTPAAGLGPTAAALLVLLLRRFARQL